MPPGKAVALLRRNTPPDTVVVPEKVLAAESVVITVLASETAPEDAATSELPPDVNPWGALFSVSATVPPPPPFPMIPFSVIAPELAELTETVCVPLLALPVTAPMVRVPVPALPKFSAVEVVLRTTGELIILAALSPPFTKMPVLVPVPPIVNEVPPLSVAATFTAKVRLLAACAPLNVMVPVVPPLMNRSSAAVGLATKVPVMAPVLSVFQKRLAPSHVNGPMAVNPAATLVSQ